MGCRNPETPNPTYIRTLNPSKLAHRLTRYCRTDSQKVYAIHHWITHHIRYDVKNYYSYGRASKPVSLTRILRRRKGIFGEYSALFRKLCTSSGVESAIINGYSKGQYYSTGNPFYMETHSWNGVYLGGQWLLVDATWDAGGIQLFKRSLKGKLLQFFTFGRQDHIVYNPHFIQRPNEKYYLRNGVYMKTDHIAAVPLWQVHRPTYSLAEAEADSSFYYKYFLTHNLAKDSLHPQRRLFAKINDRENQIISGEQAHIFNKRNHFAPGISFKLKAEDKFDQLNPQSYDSLKFYTDANLGKMYLIQALAHFDSNQTMLSNQYSNLIQRLEAKRKMLKGDHQVLLAETKASSNLLNIGYKNARSGSSLASGWKSYGNRQYQKVKSGKPFVAAKNAVKTKEADSAKFVKRIRHLLDSSVSVMAGLYQSFVRLDSLYETAYWRMADYQTQSMDYAKITKHLCDLRISGSEDPDLVVRILKDSLIKHHKQTGKLLLNDPGKMVVADWNEAATKVKSHYDKLFKIHSLIEAECVNLKKCCHSSTTAKGFRQQNLSAYGSALSHAFPEIDKIQIQTENLKIACLDHRKTSVNEAYWYQQELITGMYMYSIAAKHFKNQYQGWKSETGIVKKECTKKQTELRKSTSEFEKNRKARG